MSYEAESGIGAAPVEVGTRSTMLTLVATASSGARAALLTTRRGTIETPTFMPVATHAHVRNHSSDEVQESGAGIVLANTYHLMLRPGADTVAHFGGLHTFMAWRGGILTDSGGFQIFSLPGERALTEEGAHFRSPYDNQRHLLTPELALDIQAKLDSDIAMVLDVCVPSTSDEAACRDAMERTHRWAERSRQRRSSMPHPQAVFGIVQGGLSAALRAESASYLSGLGFDGLAVGGLAVGETRDELYRVAGETARYLPANGPRYLMGVGTPIDLVECVNVGYDMFDCILPTKMAQQKYAYTMEGQLRVTRLELRLSDDPLDAGCGCPTCRTYARGHLRHLAVGNHHLADRLLGIHNLWHYGALMRTMRQALVAGTWEATYRDLRDKLAPRIRRARPVGVARGAYEVVKLASGECSLRHLSHGEVMHPTGPWYESRRLYADQLGIAERLAVHSDEPYRVLDVGMGAAANACAALAAAQSLGTSLRRPLEIISLDNDTSALELALDARQSFPWLEVDAAERIRTERYWERGPLSWRLILGDARETVPELGAKVDAIFFDPFSSEVNPALWTVGFFRALRALAKYEGARLATYSSATPTRVALLLAGYFVGAGCSVGTRTETTIAATREGLLPELLGVRWLERWMRSSAKGPHGGGAETSEVLRHAQFAGLVAPGALAI